MKQPMSAEEWFKKLEDEFLLGHPKSELNQKCKTRNQLIHYAIESYSTYLLKHHLEQFAEEINNEFHKSGTISSILNDYLTKNNIR